MTVSIDGTEFGDIVPGIKKALDTALERTLLKQQGNLNKQPPFDSGRMASSWRIGQNGPRLDADRGEDWESAAGVPWPYEGPITFDGTWYISNNVPYAQPIAALGSFPPSWEGQLPSSVPSDWFSAIANQTGNVFRVEFDKVSP
jgi:hypothetical protein